MTFDWNLAVFLMNVLETSMDCDKTYNSLLTTGTELKPLLLQSWSEACHGAGDQHHCGSHPNQQGHRIDTCSLICLYHQLKAGDDVMQPPGDKRCSVTLQENPQPFSPQQTCSCPGRPPRGSVPFVITAGRENNSPSYHSTSLQSVLLY